MQTNMRWQSIKFGKAIYGQVIGAAIVGVNASDDPVRFWPIEIRKPWTLGLVSELGHVAGYGVVSTSGASVQLVGRSSMVAVAMRFINARPMVSAQTVQRSFDVEFRGVMGEDKRALLDATWARLVPVQKMCHLVASTHTGFRIWPGEPGHRSDVEVTLKEKFGKMQIGGCIARS